MDLNFSAEEIAFRHEVRAFIDANLPAATRAWLVAGKSPTKAMVIEWQKILNAKGWAVPEWPVQWGGPGWSAAQKYIVREELQMAPAPSCAL